MKQLITITMTLLLATAVSAQSQCKILSFDHFGGDVGDVLLERVITHEDGSFSFTMSTNSTTSTTIRTDCPEWGVMRRYNATYTELLSQDCAPIGSTFLAPTFYFYPQPDGDTILIGYAPDDFGSNDMAIERRSSSGEVRWSKHYGGSGAEAASKVALASDGNFLVLTGTNSNDGDVGFHYGSGFDADMWLVKLDTAGNLVWGKVLGGTGFDLLSTIIPDNNGGCYLFGATVSTDHDATGSHGNTDLWIVKLDGEGHKEWHKMLGGSLTDGSGYDNGVRAIRDSGSGFYVLARTDSRDGDVQQRMPIGQEDLWLLHIDSLANIIWENTYGGPGLQSSRALCRGADGSIWMAGILEGDSVGGDINVNYATSDGWIVHADSLGNFLNQRTIGANKEEEIIALHPLQDGTVLAGGIYRSSFNPDLPKTPGFPELAAGDIDIFIAHLSPDNDLSVRDQLLPEDSWNIYPNPASGTITIEIKGQEIEVYDLSIINADGKTLYSNKIHAQLSISNFNPPPGTYIVRLGQGNKYTAKKLVIRH